jgi:hypothetical protein
MQPEKGTPALYVVREAQLDVTLMAEILETGDHQTIAAELLEPIGSMLNKPPVWNVNEVG